MTLEIAVFEAVAVSLQADDFGVVDEAVDHGGGHDVVAEYLPPAPTLFWASMSDVEKIHMIEAFTFELSKCYEQRPPCMGTRGAGHGSVTREVTLSSP
jgi:hypothetical protein